MNLSAIFASAAKYVGPLTKVAAGAAIVAAISLGEASFSLPQAVPQAAAGYDQNQAAEVFLEYGEIIISRELKSKIPDPVFYALCEILKDKKTVICTPEEYLEATAAKRDQDSMHEKKQAGFCKQLRITDLFSPQVTQA